MSKPHRFFFIFFVTFYNFVRINIGNNIKEGLFKHETT